MADRQIIISEDGSHTMYEPAVGQHYHSVHGAVTESEHVFIKECLLYSNLQSAVILEAGFGTGLNALLTLKSAIEKDLEITYYSIDKYPLRRGEWTALNYGEIVAGGMKDLFVKLHESPWNSMQQINSVFRLFKIDDDLVSFKAGIEADLVYFDAFSPDVQPELWTSGIFSRIYSMMKPGGILTTYSSRGSVRRALQSCGFRVGKVPGPPGKREMVRAVK